MNAKWDAGRIAEVAKNELKALENLRKTAVAEIKRKRANAMLGVVIVLGLAILTAMAARNGIALFVGVFLSVLIYAVLSKSGARAAFHRSFKSQILPKIVKAVEPDLSFQGGEGISRSHFMASGLFASKPDRYHTEDLFIGMIGETKLRFAEIHAEDRRTRTDSKGRSQTYYVTIFKGVMMIADFHKHFSHKVTVQPDKAEKAFGWFGKKLQSLLGTVQRLENPDFERHFVVRGQDPVETRYIMTPKMQENFLSLRKRFGQGLSAAFHMSHVWIAIPSSRNWFEMDINRPVTNADHLKDLMAEIWWCTSIVDQLDLNTRIWTKD